MGDLIANSLAQRGCVAVVTDGLVRDVAALRALPLSVWCRGVTPRASRKEGPAWTGSLAVCAGVSVANGDLVIAEWVGRNIIEGRFAPGDDLNAVDLARRFHTSRTPCVRRWCCSKKQFPFLPQRVVLHDYTGVPAVVDLATMRDAIQEMGGDLARVNPQSFGREIELGNSL